MELRQLRYFVRVVALGSMGRAADDLGVVTSALSQQISRLEGELATRLLQRGARGVAPTDAGLAFFHQAQLALRHADDAAQAARQARLAGHASVGLAPSTSAVLALPLMQAMRERYPDVRLRMVESLSGNLAAMLGARQLDLAVLFETETARRLSISTMFNTGTVVGVNANVFGAGFQSKHIPSFSWGGAAEGTTEYRLEKAIQVAYETVSRRNVRFGEIEQDILRSIFEQTRPRL